MFENNLSLPPPSFQHLVEHLDLIEGVVVDLLQTKWKSFISRR